MSTPSKYLSALAVVLLSCALVAAGCGDDDDDSAGGGGGDSAESGGGAYSGKSGGSGGGGKTLKLSADPSGALRFDKTSLATAPGKVSIVMDNPSDVPHAIEVEGNGVEEEGETVGKGGVSEVSFDDLKAGEYEYYCPVGNHEAGGMKGTLTVD